MRKFRDLNRLSQTLRVSVEQTGLKIKQCSRWMPKNTTLCRRGDLLCAEICSIQFCGSNRKRNGSESQVKSLFLSIESSRPYSMISANTLVKSGGAIIRQRPPGLSPQPTATTGCGRTGLRNLISEGERVCSCSQRQKRRFVFDRFFPIDVPCSS